MFSRSPYYYYFSPTTNHSNFSSSGDCSQVNDHPWSEKCDFVSQNDQCQDVDGFINYISLIYCTFGQDLFPLAIIVLIVWLVFLFIGLAVSADDYFCPSIEVISKVLRLSQNIAGVTILAFGNGAPDIFSSIAGIGQDRPELVFGELFGAGVFVTAAVAGAVSVTKPFRLMERPFLRDVTFYLVAGFYAFYIFWRQEIRLADSIVFLLIYLIYIGVVIIGRYLNQRNRMEIPYLTQTNSEDDNDLGDGVEEEVSTGVSRHPTVTGDPPEIQLVPESQDCTSIKTNVSHLLSALNPIDSDNWSQMPVITKAYQVLKCPVELLFRLTIPVVDPEAPRQGWCQYLAIIHCILGPVFTVFAISVARDKIPGTNIEVWHLTIILSLLLGIMVGFTSRSTHPPIYHKVFAFIGFIISIVWIYIIANELVSLLRAFGVMFGLSDAILGLTVLAWGNSIGDMIADTSMAKRGSPRVGFSACFGGPLFNLLLGIGIPFTIEMISNGTSTIQLVCNKMTLVLSAGLCISLCFSFITMPIMKFKATKIYGIILIILYAVFLAICITFEFTVMDKGNPSCF